MTFTEELEEILTSNEVVTKTINGEPYIDLEATTNRQTEAIKALIKKHRPKKMDRSFREETRVEGHNQAIKDFSQALELEE